MEIIFSQGEFQRSGKIQVKVCSHTPTFYQVTIYLHMIKY